MPGSPVPHDVVFFETPAAFRAWLAANHDSAAELWVGYRYRASGLPSMTWEQSVDEALCVGWIDGIRGAVDGGHAARFTPRRPGSIWSARNVARVEALRAEGRMHPAGEAAFARRREDRTAVYSFESEAALGAEAEVAMRAEPVAWAFWEAQPPGYRRSATHWVMAAKRPETRARRLAALVTACAAGRRLAELGGRAREPA
ncbi:MAG: YdeI/OmpD-associated family protein [Chloroflexota bacterium]